MAKMRMKNIMAFFPIFCAVFVLINSGCHQQSPPPVVSGQPDDENDKYSVFAGYTPKEIDIIPLTEFVNVGDAQQAKINLFVSLLDSFGSEIKSPCVFRFELYEKIQRSAEPKGRRIIIWPDVDLIEPAINNQYWRNYLRAYEFDLPFVPEGNQTYILEVTCLCPTGKRLTSDFSLDAQD